jgi:ATP synthase protein I
MSQDSMQKDPHRTDVRAPVLDPVARKGKRAYNALSASSVGLEMGLSVAIGLIVGIYMDKWLGTTPWMMLLWLGFGLFAAFRGVFAAVKRLDKAAAIEEGERDGHS